jgi:glutathione S-transferase
VGLETDLITLYHCADARSFRCLWLLEELGLPYDLRVLPFPPRSKAPDFLEVNPCGSVPWLQDGPVGLSESAAILAYLAGRHAPCDLAVAPDEPGYPDWLQWLHFGEASLTAPLATMLRYQVLEAPERRLPAVVADYREVFLSRLAAVERVLQRSDHLAAGRFTAADISVGYALMLARMMGLQNDLPAAVRTYWARLTERPAYHRAKSRQKQAPAAQQETRP